ncbi:hypothetical protein MACH17_33380 [Phaeobacter inhibens]|uniref:hypothetical protein n=1 Tax=Phaeobacter inhibens TaxID=221822 RepID=UPI002753B529|nr:hypothetical protein [Phaeobacter inhibens]GLO71821.1 hypothetical protein MACH17_33380 [Phaeobacter inhibens]
MSIGPACAHLRCCRRESGEIATNGTDTLVTDTNGLSQISFADFGGALMDLAEQQNRPEKRLTVAWGNA